jgi:hypothetical protein
VNSCRLPAWGEPRSSNEALKDCGPLLFSTESSCSCKAMRPLQNWLPASTVLRGGVLQPASQAVALRPASSSSLRETACVRRTSGV